MMSTLVAVDLAQAARELYGLPPGEFVATRAALAQHAGLGPGVAAQIRKLPKPSVAAYVVNQLVRQRHDEVEQLIELGDALRQAQIGVDGAELRKLDQQRRQLVRAVAAEGKRLAVDSGTGVSAAAATQVDETLHAAMADPDAADAVRTGRLAKALSASGFGPVDLTDAVAVPAAMATVTSLADRRSATEKRQAERALVAARAELVAAEREAAEARRDKRAAADRLDAARTERKRITDELSRLQDELATAQEQLIAAKRDAKKAKRTFESAKNSEATAVAAEERARAALEALAARAES